MIIGGKMSFITLLINEKISGFEGVEAGKEHHFQIPSQTGGTGYILITVRGLSPNTDQKFYINQETHGLPEEGTSNWDTVWLEISGLKDGDNYIQFYGGVVEDEPPWLIKDVVIHWHN